MTAVAQWAKWWLLLIILIMHCCFTIWQCQEAFDFTPSGWPVFQCVEFWKGFLRKQWITHQHLASSSIWLFSVVPSDFWHLSVTTLCQAVREFWGHHTKYIKLVQSVPCLISSRTPAFQQKAVEFSKSPWVSKFDLWPVFYFFSVWCQYPVSVNSKHFFSTVIWQNAQS